MRTYITFEDDLSLEPYLNSKLSLQNKISFTKFRLSDTKLEIETGRSKNIPLIDRKCKQCTSGDIEDEIHFFMSCKYFDNERRELFDSISLKDNNFTTLSTQEKFIYMLSYKSNLDQIIYFLNTSMGKRKTP